MTRGRPYDLVARVGLRLSQAVVVAFLIGACGSIQTSPFPVDTPVSATAPPKNLKSPDAVEESAEGQVESASEPGSYVVMGKRYEVLDDSFQYREIGVASWYGQKFHGRLTASGEDYDMYAMSAAHKALPLPTIVRVTNLDNGAKVEVRVNDRGPFHDDRLIDLSFAAARALGFASRGTAPVVVEAIDEINHPNRVVSQSSDPLIYLQTGAFSSKESAERMAGTVGRLLHGNGRGEITVDILESSGGEGQAALYKVWVGPIASAADRDELSHVFEQGQIGKPIAVQLSR